ncbi:MAG: ABC transporter substrate-binding protein [Actinobacteria bacterium]|nr:ABC transporter substrate-binding protein [Actinomycetota bacterium]
MKVKWMTALGSCVLALALAACGSSGSGSGGSSGSSGSKSPYIIGSIDSETGPFGSSDGAGAQGIKAWATYVNSHGGINGHPVQVTVKDDQGNPSVALSDIRAFARQPNLLALVGSVSSTEESWGPIASAAHLPVVGDFPFTTISYSAKYIFPQGTTVPSALYGQAFAAIKLAHATKIGFLYCAEEPSCADSIAPVKTTAAALGGSLVNTQAVSATAPNYDAVCQAAKSAGVKALVVALGEGTIVSLAQSCSSVGFTPAYVAQSTALVPSQGSVPGLNNHAYGVVQTFPWVSAGTPAQQAFQSGIRAGGIPASANGAALSLAWTGGALFEAAAKSATGTVTRESIADALWHLPKGTTLGGLAPPLTYAANSPSPQQKCFFVMKLSGGKWTAPYGPAKTFCQA